MSINGKSVAAISPLLVFVVLYLVTSIIVRDFYKVPITVAFMVSSVYAVATMRGVPLEERVKVYSQGAGSPNLMLMIWIFILAGAFAASAKAMGAIYNPQIQISAESETKRSIFREKDKTKRSKKESAQHSKSRNKSFVMTSVSAL